MTVEVDIHVPSNCPPSPVQSSDLERQSDIHVPANSPPSPVQSSDLEREPVSDQTSPVFKRKRKPEMPEEIRHLYSLADQKGKGKQKKNVINNFEN